MPKSIKLRNNTYWDSESIVHNRQTLKDILNNLILESVYPVGSLYISTSSTSPATLFGGTWVQITDRFLYCTNSSGGTGGANSVEYTPAGSVGGHTLTTNEIPSHNHGFGFSTDPNTAGGSSGTGVFTGSGGNQYFGKFLTLTTGNSGGGKSHSHGFTGTKATINTMPAYYTVYCWRRTA